MVSHKLRVFIILAALALSTIGMIALHRRATSNLKQVPISKSVRTLFSAWKNTQNKLYTTPQEEQFRLQVFAKNHQKIKVSNSRKLGYTLGLNLFADLTEEEFVAKYTGYKHQKTKKAVKPQQAKLGQAASVDWRTQGVVNAVKNQGSCGSCWAFSAVAAFESAAKLAGYALFSFSEQQLVDCSRPEGNQGCNGGLMDQAFTYIEKSQGLATEQDYPYKGTDGVCHASSKTMQAPQIGSFTDVPKNDCQTLLASVTKQPVSVAIAANAIQFYTTGVFSNKFCGTGLNHGVAAVGYGTDASSKKNYWIVRNSWGATWGEKGYILMDRDVQPSTGICGICMAASYPNIVKP